MGGVGDELVGREFPGVLEIGHDPEIDLLAHGLADRGRDFEQQPVELGHALVGEHLVPGLSFRPEVEGELVGHERPRRTAARGGVVVDGAVAVADDDAIVARGGGPGTRTRP